MHLDSAYKVLLVIGVIRRRARGTRPVWLDDWCCSLKESGLLSAECAATSDAVGVALALVVFPQP